MSAGKIWDCVVIGGGAAGMMTAAEAGLRGASVLLLEHNKKCGDKIRISGGGRCNFTNLHAEPGNYLSQNPHFCKSALARYTPWDFLDLVHEAGISWHEKKLGQLFCDHSSKEIIHMLVERCKGAGVQLHTGCEVERVEKSELFRLDTSLGEFRAKTLVVATGGLSIPKLGATDFGYRLARQFGLPLVETRPGLVPLTVDAGDLEFFQGLRGVAVDCEVSCERRSFRENLLFTHRGLSGPAILQISSYWRPGEELSFHLLPGVSWEEELEASRSSQKQLSTLLAQWVPKRFAQQWCEREGLDNTPQRLGEKGLRRLRERIQRWSLRPHKTEGYKKAEVTLGGVDTNALSSRTMEAREVPGLYFVGEVMDVTGWLGGYNFQWAWASGHAAGVAIAERAGEG